MINHGQRKTLNEHGHWPVKSAGRKMTDKVPVVGIDLSLAESHSYLSRHAREFETVNYIYVVDRNRKLEGVFSIKDLLDLPGETRVEDICRVHTLIKVHPHASQEEAANLALKHNLKAIPVVDENNVFLGVLPNDTILHILNREFREDIFHLTGIHTSHAEMDNIMEIPLILAVRHRLPWLLLGLIGGVFAAKVIGLFEAMLAKNLILAAFIPLVVYISDAVGTQLEAFTIRDFVLFKKLNLFAYFLKQLAIVFLVSVSLSLIFVLLSYLLGQGGGIAIVLGMTIVAASLSSLFTGVLIPAVFRGFKLDPANASGPIGTIIQDIMSVVIYFTIASWIL